MYQNAQGCSGGVLTYNNNKSGRYFNFGSCVEFDQNNILNRKRNDENIKDLPQNPVLPVV